MNVCHCPWRKHNGESKKQLIRTGGWLITDDVLVITHIIESYTKNPAEYGFFFLQSVTCLLDIVCVRIVINILGYLIDSWQRMQDTHIVLCFP